MKVVNASSIKNNKQFRNHKYKLFNFKHKFGKDDIICKDTKKYQSRQIRKLMLEKIIHISSQKVQD